MPIILAQYDEIDPGRAAKLFDLFEEQSRHRMTLEKKVTDSDISRSWGGLVVGGLLSTVLCIGGIWLISQGHDTAGGTIITATMGGVLIAFVTGRKSQRQERDSKAEKLGGKKK